MAHQAQKVQSVQQDQWTRVSGRDGLSSYAVYSKEIQKPDLDDRSYRMIRLENGLEALLIHDPNTDKAAAAMNVGVGSLSDPVSFVLLFRSDPR
jgi:insulysin